MNCKQFVWNAYIFSQKFLKNFTQLSAIKSMLYCGPGVISIIWHDFQMFSFLYVDSLTSWCDFYCTNWLTPVFGRVVQNDRVMESNGLTENFRSFGRCHGRTFKEKQIKTGRGWECKNERRSRCNRDVIILEDASLVFRKDGGPLLLQLKSLIFMQETKQIWLCSFMTVSVCVCACVRACARVCVCVRARVCVCVSEKDER